MKKKYRLLVTTSESSFTNYEKDFLTAGEAKECGDQVARAIIKSDIVFKIIGGSDSCQDSSSIIRVTVFKMDKDRASMVYNKYYFPNNE